MQDLARKMLQDVPNIVWGRVHSDCATNLASPRQAFRHVTLHLITVLFTVMADLGFKKMTSLLRFHSWKTDVRC